MTTTPATPAESDPFFQLLTDALRAGPGSPQWGEAVAKLRDGGVEGADEYALILRAREDVELGRDYRKVSAGAEFTRKVLGAVEREGKRPSGVPTATIVAILAGLVILGVIVTVIVIMSRGGADARKTPQAAVERLEGVSFALSSNVSDFSGPLPANWREVGRLPLTRSGGLRAGSPPVGSAGALVGGVVLTDPLPADQPFAVDVELDVPQANTGAPVQVFVSEAADFSQGPPGTKEVVVTLRDEHATLDVDGKSVTLPGTYRATPKESKVKVSLRVGKDVVIAEVGGRRIYAGAHGLSPDKPRYTGVRFVRSSERDDSAAVRSITVSRAASSAAGAH